jgi:hypothetical protein
MNDHEVQVLAENQMYNRLLLSFSENSLRTSIGFGLRMILLQIIYYDETSMQIIQRAGRLEYAPEKIVRLEEIAQCASAKRQEILDEVRKKLLFTEEQIRYALKGAPKVELAIETPICQLVIDTLAHINNVTRDATLQECRVASTIVNDVLKDRAETRNHLFDNIFSEMDEVGEKLNEESQFIMEGIQKNLAEADLQSDCIASYPRRSVANGI